MCLLRIIECDCSKASIRKSIKAGKIIEEQINRRALEQFYEEVKNNKELFDRDYHIEVLKKKGFTFE
jgi:hypothetical protein